MKAKTNDVKYVSALFILILLQFTYAVTPQDPLTPNSTSFGAENVGSDFKNGSTAAGNNKSTTELSTNVLPTRNSDLLDKKRIDGNGSFVKDADVKESEYNKGLDNATKGIEFDSKKEKETAHIHIYTGL
jgi:hypothetical protein